MVVCKKDISHGKGRRWSKSYLQLFPMHIPHSVHSVMETKCIKTLFSHEKIYDSFYHAIPAISYAIKMNFFINKNYLPPIQPEDHVWRVLSTKEMKGISSIPITIINYNYTITDNFNTIHQFHLYLLFSR